MKKLALTSLFVLPATALIAIIAATTSAEQDTSAQRPKDADSRAAVAEPSPSKEQPSVASPAADEPATWWEEESDRYPRRRMVCRKVDGKLHGEWKAYAEDGRLLHEGHYDHDVPEGPTIAYYPNGNKFCEAPFRNGKINGQVFLWFEDGTIAETALYVDGVMSGRAAAYYPSGTLRCETDFLQGNRHGLEQTYLPDGRLYKVQEWKNDQLINELILNQAGPKDLQALEQHSTPRFSDFKGFWK